MYLSVFFMESDQKVCFCGICKPYLAFLCVSVVQKDTSRSSYFRVYADTVLGIELKSRRIFKKNEISKQE
jgi:hypothetical protein